MKKNIIFLFLIVSSSIILSNCEDAKINSTNSKTVDNIIYKPNLNDWQKNNLKGKVKKILNKDESYQIYNDSGFLLEELNSKGELINKVYNSFNLVLKITTKLSHTDNEILTYVYNDKNLVTKFINNYNKEDLSTSECTYTNYTGNCKTISSLSKIIFYTTFTLNASYSIIKEYTTNNTNANTETKIYDDYRQLLITNDTIFNEGSKIIQKYEYTYNSNFQRTSSKTTINSSGTDNIKTDINEYGANGFITKKPQTNSNGVDDVETYTNYILDSKGNWTSRVVTWNNSVSVTDTRTITYFE